MSILALALRALAVTVLMTTISASIVDHHALARLPDAAPTYTEHPGDPVRELLMHHHSIRLAPGGAAPALSLPAIPAFVPTPVLPSGDSIAGLTAAVVLAQIVCAIDERPFADHDRRPALSLAEPPPLTPPRLPA